MSKPTDQDLPKVGDRVRILSTGRAGKITALPAAQTGPHAAYGEVIGMGEPWAYQYYTVRDDDDCHVGPELWLRNHFTVIP